MLQQSISHLDLSILLPFLCAYCQSWPFHSILAWGKEREEGRLRAGSKPRPTAVPDWPTFLLLATKATLMAKARMTSWCDRPWVFCLAALNLSVPVLFHHVRWFQECISRYIFYWSFWVSDILSAILFKNESSPFVHGFKKLSLKNDLKINEGISMIKTCREVQ